MGRTICVCLLACLAVGLAVPVPESTAPDNEQDLKNLILNAKPEDNDISGSPTENQVAEESEDTAIVDSAAVTEKEIEDPIGITDGTAESYITTPKEVEEPAVAPKVNQTELPKATATLEPTDENAPVVTNEEQDLPYQPVREDVPSWSDYDYSPQATFEDDSQVIQITEDLPNEDDLVDVVPDENQETFEDDSQVIQITEGLLNEDDLVDVILDDNQETFEDDSQVIQITEGLLNEDDLVDVVPDENQETFEDDSQVIQITEGLLNEDDLVDVILDDNQETFEDDSQVLQITEDDLVDIILDDNQETFEDDSQVIPVFGAGTVFEGEQILPETDEQMPSEEEREVIVVFDERSPFIPTPEEMGQFEGEEDEEQNVFPEGEEIFIIEDDFHTPEDEEEEERFLLNDGEEQMVPFYDDFEEAMPTELEDSEQMPALVISEDSYFSEEPFIRNPNEESIFGSPFPSSDGEMLPVDIGEESEFPVDYDQITDDKFDGAYYPDDVSDNPFMFVAPSEYYIPEESSSGGDIENDEVLAFPENENDSFTDVILNEPIPMRNDNETPEMVNILMIKAKPLLSEGRPTIEVISTDFSQMPPRFEFGAALPVNDEQEPVISEIPDYTREDGTFTNDSELPEQSGFLTPNMLSQEPIIFPEEFVPKYNLPVFPNRWTEENFYEPQRMQSQDNVPFEPFAYSSYSKYSSNRIPGSSYGSPALPFNPYEPSQEQSFSGPNSHQQNFGEEQSEDMNGMMNNDMQPMMPNTMPLSSSDASMFDYEDMQENEEHGHFHLTDDVPQNSRFSNVPNRFDSFVAAMMPTREDISQDFHGPNTFPLNFRNPNVDGDNTDVNIFSTPFQTDRSQGDYQQNQQYDVRPSFSPYQSRYNVLSGNQASRFDSRYPIVSELNPFNSYGPYNFYYSPYDNYNLFRTPGLYSPRPMKRYSMNYGLNYPTPLW